jgi:hypothetical protein
MLRQPSDPVSRLFVSGSSLPTSAFIATDPGRHSLQNLFHGTRGIERDASFEFNALVLSEPECLSHLLRSSLSGKGRAFARYRIMRLQGMALGGDLQSRGGSYSWYTSQCNELSRYNLLSAL